MSAFEQRVETPPDGNYQFLLFAAEPYETIGGFPSYFLHVAFFSSFVNFYVSICADLHDYAPVSVPFLCLDVAVYHCAFAFF